MNSEKINQLLKSEPRKYTYAEIEQMMDEELSKDPSEMDTDFIDFCADLLCKALDAHKENELNTNSKNKKQIKLKLSRIVAAALVAALVLAATMTVSARYVYNDTSDKIVKFCEDHFSINLRGANSDNDTRLDDSADLIAKLKDSGFEKVMLPNVLLENDYTYAVKIAEENDTVTTALVDFDNVNDNKEIRATITKYKNGIDFLLDNDLQITAEYNSAKQLSLNGIDIFVFGNKDTSTITYIDNNTSYQINLINYDFDLAIELSKSIK